MPKRLASVNSAYVRRQDGAISRQDKEKEKEGEHPLMALYGRCHAALDAHSLTSFARSVMVGMTAMRTVRLTTFLR